MTRTSPAFEPSPAGWTPGPSASAPSGEPGDQQLIEQTRHQIRNLVHEIAQLAQAEIAPEAFYAQFLDRVVAALAAVGGAVWTAGDEGRLELAYQISMAQAGFDSSAGRKAQHQMLLRKAVSTAQPTIVPPQSGTTEPGEAGNPSQFLVILAPVVIDQQVQAIVEVLQRPGGGPTTQRGYLRFVMQMCELAADYLKNCRLRQYGDRQETWLRVEGFLRAVHRSLRPQQVAYTIANDGRKLIEADRISALACFGRTCRVLAVSGLDHLDARSAIVSRLAALAKAAIAAGEPVWYTGDSRDLPPEIETHLQAYLDESHAKLLAVIPLFRPAEEEAPAEQSAERPQRQPAVGALIVEQLRDARPAEGLQKRVEIVAEHSAAALSNALDHDGIFLMPLWRALGRMKVIVAARTLPRTLAALAAVAAVLVGLVIVPAPFALSGRGTLEPQLRREVFAGIDGVVVEVPVEHGQNVAAGQLLARLRNTDLEVAVADLLGRRTATREQILSVQRALLGENRLSIDEQNRLSGQLLQLKETADSLDQQLALYRQKEKLLEIACPIAGQVVTWHARDLLIHRPVETGQALLTVVDPTGAWELELHMPESRMGHVARAWRNASENGDDLEVSFMLATHPGQEFSGRVIEIHGAADAQEDEGNTVLIRVAIDKEELPDLRPGAGATAKVACGWRPIGYVWFQDVIEFVQGKILFWL